MLTLSSNLHVGLPGGLFPFGFTTKSLYALRFSLLQGAAEITPTFQRGITNKWYEVSPTTFYFPNVDITKFFLL
jgi:hypothetical protein